MIVLKWYQLLLRGQSLGHLARSSLLLDQEVGLMMKAALLTHNASGEGSFKIESVEKPKLRNAGEVLVKIKAFGVNPIDCQMRKGMSEVKLLKSPILGRDCAGVVEEVGSNVKKFKPGDRVYAYVGSVGSNGAYAEYVSVPETILSKFPATFNFVQAAAVPLGGLTALQCYERIASTSRESSIFVSGGSGGVGTMLLQILRSQGFRNVCSIFGNDLSGKHLMELGLAPQDLIDYREKNYSEKVLKRNGNLPYDICIDLVGGPTSEICASLLKITGTYVDVTFFATPEARELLFDKAANIVCIANYAYGSKEELLPYYGERLARLSQMVEQGSLLAPKIALMKGLLAASILSGHQIIDENATAGRKVVVEVEA